MSQPLRYTGLLIGAALALLPALVWAAALSGWVGAEPPFNLIPDDDGQHVELALGPVQTAMVWAGRTTPGIYLALQTGSTWTTTTLTTTAEVHHPVAAYSGSQWLIAWTQGVISDVTVVCQTDGQPAQVLGSHLYGEAFPHLQAGPTGHYLTFAAATTYLEKTQTDLYLSYRPLTTTVWSSPAIIISRTQVVPGQSGGVWNPRLALSPDGQTLHLVWQQTAGPVSRTVWYLSGTWTTAGLTWGQPQQVSPPDQAVAVLPDIAATNRHVYISWTEVEGGVAYSNTQYINLWQTGSAARRISAPFYVNNVQPTWAASTLGAQGQQVCAAWHANAPGIGSGEGKEEIWLQCSTNEGQTWQPLLNISETPDTYSLNPKLEIGSGGRVALVWTEVRVEADQRKFYDTLYRIGPARQERLYLPLILRRA